MVLETRSFDGPRSSWLPTIATALADALGVDVIDVDVRLRGVIRRRAQMTITVSGEPDPVAAFWCRFSRMAAHEGRATQPSTTIGLHRVW